ncbi:PHA/PHB synthase family protein [Rhizorhapis sp. SPR117]|uniref:PHA/PHB synthase family protein n=1 Tax=Rhizorhapis sp. SPR117 TaxID=2912611 RepID=UPI001F010A6A|nr:class I poly(R)-hydroxyalkanoic acid synthase [Rhizorhapis sp. SPR117]
MSDADLKKPFDTVEPPLPTLDQMQHWTRVIGQAQQLLLEYSARQMAKAEMKAEKVAGLPLPIDPEAVGKVHSEFWANGVTLWQRFLESGGKAPGGSEGRADGDRRFSAPQWQSDPLFDIIRRSYLLTADYMMDLVDTVDGIAPKQKDQLRFATKGIIDAMSPSNFALTNPLVLEKTLETNGDNLLRGLQNMLNDIDRRQLSHVDGGAFEVGRNIAVTPGKVIKETPLYQLIQYEPTTKEVLKTPLVIFPPWINRFYILDLNPEKSFIRWAVEQGITVFVVSWKSADESMKNIAWDDYIVRGQIDAIDTVRELLDVPNVHTIGYCVAGTTLAATLALLAARKEAGKVKSATFFTAQVDFSKAGDLGLFVDDELLKLVKTLSADGYLDGRYMAATFNLLRGRDLIWSYVVNNYLLGQDYKPFDLLYWNGDTTNLPAKWHQSYLADLYRDNKLVQPGVISIDGTPIDLRKVKTPSYIQAGREDHIAPPESVWKITEHFSGPLRFVLAGSGHIAGVVNPPSAGKYQYWTCEKKVQSLSDYVACAKETQGSWWPDWIDWLEAMGNESVPSTGARKPGKGGMKAIEDAPGRYVKTR